MPRTSYLALILVALISACAGRLQEAARQVSVLNAECDARLASGELKTRVEHARCINDNENKILQPVNPFP